MMKKKIITFGEVLMRLSPENYATFAQTKTLDMEFGGGEANVGITLAYLGEHASHITAFPAHYLGRSATQFLRHHWLHTDDIQYLEGRMALYFVEQGVVHRPSRVVYDRDATSFSHIKADTFQWDKILREADWLHWTAITPAIANGPAQSLKNALQQARQQQVKVSCDLTYRAQLWKEGRKPHEVLPEMLEHVQVLMGSPFDFAQALGKNDLSDMPFEAAAQHMMKQYPHIEIVADKIRGTKHASHYTIEGIIWNGQDKITTEVIDIPQVVERIGSGDAFAAGLIYGLLHYEDQQEALRFGAATCALKHTLEGDICPVYLEDIKRVMKGGKANILR
ncbi:sugar kinase [Catalinimonas niigatensis]|uniref:sugar kinase n=1 Tax=Catalinimonas niigatensis TaxID=1397264 RepID=UPI00266506BF|nr:sugar kinase [Catalinimonas niigatensis]WPP50474.1 sugar kinase [Catalinimonas niigatensis]